MRIGGKEVTFRKPNYEVLKRDGLVGADMHFHSQYSMDSVSRMDNFLRKASKLGIGVAVTDHNAIKGNLSAQKNRYGVMIIPGVEITCQNGAHVMCYFHTPGELEEFFTRSIKPLMKKNPFAIPATAREVIEIANDYQGVVGAPHPFAPGPLGLHKIKIPKFIQKKVKLIEALNGYDFRKSNLKSLAWAKEQGKGITGGSDGHATLELGKVLTCAHADDAESFLYELRRRRSHLVGKEDNLLMKAMYGIGKQASFLRRSNRHNQALLLLKSQFGNEYKYYKEKVKEGKLYRRFHDHHNHRNDKKELKREYREKKRELRRELKTNIHILKNGKKKKKK